jgi:two-component system, NarL family, invasion response regulator UvrY
MNVRFVEQASRGVHERAARMGTTAPERGRGVVRVMCVDDHALLLEGLRAQFGLDPGVEYVGGIANAERLEDEAERLGADVVLLDIEMPGPDVFEAADRLHHTQPGRRFAFLSAHVRQGGVAAAFRCGASGYFSKSDSLEELVAGLKTIARSPRGTFVMGAKVRERCGISAETLRPGDDAERQLTPVERLTAREIEVLRLIGKGLSRTEIAHELSRSAKTIDGHQERILRKLGLGCRSELMRFAIREGLAEA